MPLLIGLDLSASNLGACISTHIALRKDWLCRKHYRPTPSGGRGRGADADAPLMYVHAPSCLDMFLPPPICSVLILS